MARILKSTLRGSDTLGRYGGEEFCVVLPLMDIDGAMIATEQFRRNIESARPDNHGVTISLGVSAVSCGSHSTTELVEQADQDLYASKKAGRNRITRFDEIDESALANDQPALFDEPAEPESIEIKAPILTSAVASVLMALAHRDSATAFSRRVVGHCVAVAKELMFDSYSAVLEAAALLHDIGKLGMPDAILIKPVPLTESEWEIMKARDEMGGDIVASACQSARLVDIIRKHHA